MTTCKINRDGCRYCVDISGHAGYNPGQDIVCAAVSVLAYTYMQCVRDMEEAGELEKMRLEYMPGKVLVDVTAKPIACKHLDSVIEVIETGLELLHHQYPGHVIVIAGA